VLCLLEDHDLRQRLGSQGRARVAACYTVEQMAARYEAVYQCR
jgi:glycosyltransferase involved in cell wall biosynthesis